MQAALPSLVISLAYSITPTPPCLQLVCEVVKQLEGAYALLIKSSVYPGELVACRRGSPLILGMMSSRHWLPSSPENSFCQFRNTRLENPADQP
jgi:glucosamine 6-phosphate synthetase-like amidotransferase/phosphosugar isomerase protein